jgi:hypothetical protein
MAWAMLSILPFSRQFAQFISGLSAGERMRPEPTDDAQSTPSFRHAARNKATRLATWKPISARSDLSFSPNSARMIIGLKALGQ